MLAEPLASIQHVIAVVGCQRSGTTLTGQILGAHPAAVLLDETDGMYAWFHARTGGLLEADARAGAMLAAAQSKYRDPAQRFTHADGAIALAPSITTLVLKAPNLTYDDDLFAGLGVPVTIVYPIRDPRAVAASMQRLERIDFVANQMRLMNERPRIAARYANELRALAERETSPAVRRAIVWRIKSGRADDFRAQSLRVSFFRYEDLICSRAAVITQLADDCGLHPASAFDDWNAAYIGDGPGGTDRTRAIDASSLTQWESVLSAEQSADVLQAAEPLAGTYGYR